ncbi:MAG: arylsulfatase [Bryobacteraceae bacterium]|nr:arylsulfatase [Bryobacteraceae bacterium]
MANTTRRTLLAGGAGLAAACAQQSAYKPNIVYVILDDFGLYDAGCYGSKAIRTPNIDRLAAEGMLFTDAYSGCSVCAPARSTIMTGLHMGHTPVRGNSGGISLRAEDYTMAGMLTNNGYTCGGFGKWGIGELDTPGAPEKHGFERFFGYYHQVHAHYFYPDYLIDTGRKVPLPGNRGFYESKPKAGAFPLTDPASGRRRTFSAYAIVEEMKKFLRTNKDRPFFCYAPWTIPHARHEVPESDPAWALYRDKPWPIEARVHASYCSMADRFLGETLALLKELNLESNTLVLFSSDNGAAETYGGSLDSAGNLRGQKTLMYEGGIRTPLVARWPGRIKAGARTDAPVYFPDLLPTFAELTGSQRYAPQEVDGVSLAGLLTGKGGPPPDRHMYWEWNGAHFAKGYDVQNQACRRGDWKIVRNKAGQPWELYHLKEDPGERNDLAAKNPKLVAELDAWVRANRASPPPQTEPSKPEGQQWR